MPDQVLSLIGRDSALFETDITTLAEKAQNIVETGSFLVIGGAGSIGQAVVKELFSRNPKVLHVVDISENNLVELVRDLRSSYGYIDGEFKTFALDVGSQEFEAFVKTNRYDYVLNLSALKHVRSEKDPYTLMRMVRTNINNTCKSIELAIKCGAKKYFCVSTDKAANPVNMMGASKRIMELFLMRYADQINISMARFANVAFSDGSLLHGFNQRILKKQPIAAPNDIKRYFVTPKESGQLCLLSCLFGQQMDIFFPKLSEQLHLITFADIAEKYLHSRGYEPVACSSEDEARKLAKDLDSKKQWPCYFFKSDTTGEKDFEEFFTDSEELDLKTFSTLGVIKNEIELNPDLQHFEDGIQALLNKGHWSKKDILDLFYKLLPEFAHCETGRYLDQKM
jgi:FlaA1/EpsC-like NDP-sugar epimerase